MVDDDHGDNMAWLSLLLLLLLSHPLYLINKIDEIDWFFSSFLHTQNFYSKNSSINDQIIIIVGWLAFFLLWTEIVYSQNGNSFSYIRINEKKTCHNNSSVFPNDYDVVVVVHICHNHNHQQQQQAAATTTTTSNRFLFRCETNRKIFGKFFFLVFFSASTRKKSSSSEEENEEKKIYTSMNTRLFFFSFFIHYRKKSFFCVCLEQRCSK